MYVKQRQKKGKSHVPKLGKGVSLFPPKGRIVQKKTVLASDTVSGIAKNSEGGAIQMMLDREEGGRWYTKRLAEQFLGIMVSGNVEPKRAIRKPEGPNHCLLIWTFPLNVLDAQTSVHIHYNLVTGRVIAAHIKEERGPGKKDKRRHPIDVGMMHYVMAEYEKKRRYEEEQEEMMRHFSGGYSHNAEIMDLDTAKNLDPN